MHIVAVAEVGGKECAVEVRRALVAVVAPGIVVVELEAHARPLVGVDGELGVQTVLTVGIVAAVVVVDVGEWREGVGEVHLLGLLYEEAVGLSEDERAALLAVDEDAAQAGRVVVARGVVLAIDARVERGVLEEVWQGVGCGRHDVAELPTFEEAGACGTAAVISPIGEIVDIDENKHYVYCPDGKPGKWSTKMYETLVGIQYGDIPDPFGWITILENI